MLRRWPLLVILPISLAVGTGLYHLHAAPLSTGGAILTTIGRSATISVAPGRANAENTFIVTGVTAPAVRILSRSLDMHMGSTQYVGGRLGNGAWQVVNVEVPMIGRWGIEVQSRHNRTWITVGDVAYQVPFRGKMNLVHMTQTKRP